MFALATSNYNQSSMGKQKKKTNYEIYINSTRSLKSFFWTIRQLEDSEELSKEYDRKSITRNSNFLMHTYEPLIFLKTIMLELILKQLHFLETKTWIKNHESIDVFDKLDNADKIFIETEYNSFKKETKLNNSGFVILDFRRFIEINKKFIIDLKYGDGLYMEKLTLYPSHKFYETIINYIIPKHKEYQKKITEKKN